MIIEKKCKNFSGLGKTAMWAMASNTINQFNAIYQYNGNEVVAKCDGITSTILIVLASKQHLILTVSRKEKVIFTIKKVMNG